MTAFFVAVAVLAILGVIWWSIKSDREDKLRWAQTIWRARP